MARRKIREYDGKRLLCQFLPQYSNNTITISFQTILITPRTNLKMLPAEYPWLKTTKLVCKPDQLFGKRKEYNLVLLNATTEQTQKWLKQHMHKECTIGKANDTLTHFIIEPFHLHTEEYYLSLTSQRDGTLLCFSTQGGFNIEERWDSVKQLLIPTLTKPQDLNPKTITNNEKVTTFMKALYHIFLDLNFSSLEINPFVIDNNKQIQLLDLVAEIDDCASFKNQHLWGDLPFPTPFGRKQFPEEAYIQHLDEQSGASLKLTILNPKGKIWNILSGGGASILFLDSLVRAGYGKEIANYGEYSGNPTTEESYAYAKTILDIMSRNPTSQRRVLIIGGAIANFTDIEKTFNGIARAIEEFQKKIQSQSITIFIRRGGPNEKQGLQIMRDLAKRLSLPIHVYGPETPMTSIVPLALKKLKR